MNTMIFFYFAKGNSARFPDAIEKVMVVQPQNHIGSRIRGMVAREGFI